MAAAIRLNSGQPPSERRERVNREIKKCGREQGAPRSMNPGSVHHIRIMDIPAGWSGTLCGGKVQGTFAQKEMNCLQCERYERYNLRSGLERQQLVRDCAPEMLLYIKACAEHPTAVARNTSSRC